MKAGSYVECINDTNWDAMAFILLSALPVKGRLYQVRRVIPNFDENCTEDGIAIYGIYGDWRTFQTYYNTQVFEEYHFRMSRFREIENPILTEEIVENEELLCFV